MYDRGNIDKSNETRGWQARFADDLIELAHRNGKKVVYISANIPYDTAVFSDADAILAAYCANGMAKLPVDGEENPAYGVNYPAAIITAFGGNSPTGKLPVDVYTVDENAKFTDEIRYPLGFGLSYKSEKAVTETTTAVTSASTTTTTAAKSSTATTASKAGTSSPNTGSSAPALAAIILALSGTAAFAARKKK